MYILVRHCWKGLGFQITSFYSTYHQCGHFLIFMFLNVFSDFHPPFNCKLHENKLLPLSSPGDSQHQEKCVVYRMGSISVSNFSTESMGE